MFQLGTTRVDHPNMMYNVRSTLNIPVKKPTTWIIAACWAGMSVYFTADPSEHVCNVMHTQCYLSLNLRRDGIQARSGE